MYKDKRCIGIVFDASFLIYDVMIPMQKIYDILDGNKDNVFVYGGIERLCWHVEKYAEDLGIPKENLIRMDIPSCVEGHKKVITKDYAMEWFNTFLSYGPDMLIVFRDNTHQTDTSRLISNAVVNTIYTIEYNNRGEFRNLGVGVNDANKYYHSIPGRVVRKGVIFHP